MEGSYRLFFTIFFLAIVSPAASDKVPVELYYETLCPYCSNFIVNYLPSIFKNGLISIVDLRLVPYGNGQIDSKGGITCQHGVWECFLNTIEACAVVSWPDAKVHFNFVYCLERLIMDNKYTEWQSCFQSTGLGSQAVLNCFNSGYGHKLDLQFAKQTDALQPRHTYVPWLLVDGVPLYDDYRNFEAYICKAYDGDLPEACGQQTLAITQDEKASLADQVCFVNETKLSSSATKTREPKIKMLSKVF